MKNKTKWSGVFPAVLIPFNEDDSIDEQGDYFTLIRPPIHKMSSLDIQLESGDTQVEST